MAQTAKTTTTNSTTEFLSAQEKQILAFNLPPHKALAEYAINQVPFLSVERSLHCRTDYVKNKFTKTKEPQDVIRKNVTVWRDQDGEIKYYFDEVEADRCVNWLHRIGRHIFGPQRGQRIELSPWQIWIVRELCGWRRIGTAFRRYKYLFLFIPRKNGKTLFIALLALLLLLIDREQGPQIFNVASSSGQSETMFEMAKALCGGTKKSPFGYAHDDLRSRTDVLEKNISCQKNGGYIVPLPWNAGAFHGKNPSGLIIEEFHRHPDNTMKSVGEKGMGVRMQPLVLIDSTAPDRYDSPCGKELDQAKRIINGSQVTPNYLPIVFQAKLSKKKGRTWDSIEVAAECNPQFGISLTREFFEDEIRKAKEDPVEELEYKRHQLCLIVDTPTAVAPYHFWVKGKRQFDFRQFIGKPIYMGLDLGSVDDLSALAMVHPGRLLNAPWYVHAQFWCPEYTVEHSRNRELYLAWKKQGRLIVTPGAAMEYDFVEEQIVEWSEKFKIRKGKVDPYNAPQLVQNLIDDHGLPFHMQRQHSTHMSEPIKQMITLIRNKRLVHNNPILDWMFQNTIVVPRAHGLVSLDKLTADAKIDGMVALAMAIAAGIDPEDDEDAFEQRGPRVI